MENNNFNSLNNNCITFNKFFNFLIEQEKKLFIPELQRMLSWKPTKIDNLLNSYNKVEFFGNITLSVNKKDEYSILDGQQRILFFLLVKSIILEKNIEYEILNSEQFIDNSAALNEFRNLYKDKGLDKSINHLKKYGFDKYINTILKFCNNHKDKLHSIISSLLNKKYITISVLDDNECKIKKSEVFINLNSSNVELQKTDILKAKFLENIGGLTPTEISRPWHEMIESSYVYCEENNTLQDLILQCINVYNNKYLTKKNILEYYDSKINELKSQEEKNKFIKIETNNFNVFTTTFYSLIYMDENKFKNLNEAKKNLYNFCGFFTNPKNKMLYNPLIYINILYLEKILKNDGLDCLKNIMSWFLKSHILVELNKKIDDDFKIPSNAFKNKINQFVRNHIVGNNDKKNIDIFNDINLPIECKGNKYSYSHNPIDFFNYQEKINENNKERFFNLLNEKKESLKKVFIKKMISDDQISDDYKKEKYKNKKYRFLILQWFYSKKIEKNSSNYFLWKKENNKEIEHFIEKDFNYKIDEEKRKNDPLIIFWLEKKLSDDWNAYWKNEKNREKLSFNDIIKEKLKFYKDSNIKLNQIFVEQFNDDEKIKNCDDIVKKSKKSWEIILSEIFDYLYDEIIDEFKKQTKL